MKRLLTAALAVACLLAVSTVALAATVTVKATSKDKWSPAHLFITKGDAVQWKNPSSRLHDLKSTSKNWTFKRVLDPGEGAKRSFGKTGFFKYRCLRHSSLVNGVCRGMCGYIHVHA